MVLSNIVIFVKVLMLLMLFFGYFVKYKIVINCIKNSFTKFQN